MSKTTIPTGGITDATIATGDIADDAVTVAKTSGVGFGVQNVDQFRLTSNFTNSAQPIASNLSRVSEVGTAGGEVGSQMAVSSGIFTFPQTGIYLVKYNITAIIGSNGEDGKVQPFIEITTDNSSYSTIADSQFNLADDSNGSVNRGSTELNILFDVTNTTTHKVRFSVITANSSTQINGNTNENRTYMTFIRLGDT
jgi:hypothetical protein